MLWNRLTSNQQLVSFFHDLHTTSVPGMHAQEEGSIGKFCLNLRKVITFSLTQSVGWFVFVTNTLQEQFGEQQLFLFKV